MGVWVLIYVKFWGEQCSLVKVCQKDFIFKTSGARIWSKFGSPIRRSSRGDRSGTAHHGWVGSKKFQNRTMKIFLREMGEWALIHVKFWGGQCGLVKVCKKDFIFKTSGARIWSKFGSPIRRSSRGDRSGTAHHGWVGSKKFQNRTMKFFLREMGVWVLIYVKFWGEQCSLVKVCQKDFIFKTSGARIWSKFGSPIRRSSRGDRSGTAHHGWVGSKKFQNRTMKFFLREMGVWVLIHVKFWGGTV